MKFKYDQKVDWAINKGLTVLNTPGTVDSGYVGEIQVIVFNTNNHSVTVSKGMKVAQWFCACSEW